MSHGPIEPSTEGRAAQFCPWVARRGTQHEGGNDGDVAGLWPIAAASLSLSARGTGPRPPGDGAFRLDSDHDQDPWRCRGSVTHTRQEQRLDHGRDRGSCRVDVFVVGKETWLREVPRNAAMSNSTMCSIANSLPSFSRPTISWCRSTPVSLVGVL